MTAWGSTIEKKNRMINYNDIDKARHRRTTIMKNLSLLGEGVGCWEEEKISALTRNKWPRRNITSLGSSKVGLDAETDKGNDRDKREKRERDREGT